MERPKIIAIVGPTASGKTALGIALARRFGGEIISADSRQIYRGLDIGSGKVTKKETAGVPHHLLSIASPKKPFSAGEFAKCGQKEIEKIIGRGHVPIVAGGTGFYADALLGQVALPEVPPNAQLRKRLSTKTAPQLFATLKKLDPNRAATIDPHNPVRLVRAIEIATALGKVPETARDEKFDTLWLGIDIPQKKLEKNIHDRLLARLKAGMIAEARRLHAGGLSYRRMEELGLEYRYLAWHLQGKLSKEEMVEQLDRAIKNYAKRQMRYLRRNKNIVWIKNEKDTAKHATSFLNQQL